MSQQAATSPARAKWRHGLSADLTGLGVLASVSLLTGLLLNAWRHQPLPLVYHSSEERLYLAVTGLASGEARSLTAPSTHPAREIGLDEFQAFATARRGIIIDARPAFLYRDGHVPGALSLPRDDFEAAYRQLGARLSLHKTGEMAIYCSGADCHDAALVAEALRTLGYSRVSIYVEGWEEWSQSGLAQEK